MKKFLLQICLYNLQIVLSFPFINMCRETVSSNFYQSAGKQTKHNPEEEQWHLAGSLRRYRDCTCCPSPLGRHRDFVPEEEIVRGILCLQYANRARFHQQVGSR